MAYITDPAELVEDLRSQNFDDAADMIERLMAENAKLREALRLFADRGMGWIEWISTQPEDTVIVPESDNVSIEALMHAARAMHATHEPKDAAK